MFVTAKILLLKEELLLSSSYTDIGLKAQKLVHLVRRALDAKVDLEPTKRNVVKVARLPRTSSNYLSWRHYEGVVTDTLVMLDSSTDLYEIKYYSDRLVASARKARYFSDLLVTTETGEILPD